MGEVEENTKCRTTENQDCKEILQGKKNSTTKPNTRLTVILGMCRNLDTRYEGADRPGFVSLYEPIVYATRSKYYQPNINLWQT